MQRQDWRCPRSRVRFICVLPSVQAERHRVLGVAVLDGLCALDCGLCLRISVKVISRFGERDQMRKGVLRGQEIVA